MKLDKVKSVEELNLIYDKMQKQYGEKKLHAITNGGCYKNPKICFVFMNPTGRNIASLSDWKGIHSPWIGTKNVWKLFFRLGILRNETFDKIQSIKGCEWTEDFAKEVYEELEKNGIYITNLGKCTQIDARPLPDSVYLKYLKYLEKEIELINPKVIILFGNQVSSIVLKEKISVSTSRKKEYIKKINKKDYKCFPVYYPIGNGIFNIDKSIEDINWIKDNVI